MKKAIMSLSAVIILVSVLICSIYADEKSAIIEGKPFADNYREQLTEKGKYLYDSFYEALLTMKDGKSKASFKPDIDITQADFSLVFNAAINAVIMDNPGLYYIDVNSISIGYSYTTYISEITLKLKSGCEDYYVGTYSGKDELNQEISKINSIIDGIVKEAGKYSTVYEKLKYFHDWLIKNNTYNSYVSDGQNDLAPESAWTVISAFTSNNDEKKGPVCEGYTEAFQMLCNKINVPCVTVPGSASSGSTSGSHVWNAVQIDGKWYNADITWDDPTGSSSDTSIRDTYFLVGNNTKCDGVKFSTSHTVNTFDTMNGNNFSTPEISSDAYSTGTTKPTETVISVKNSVYGSPITITASVTSSVTVNSGTLRFYLDDKIIHESEYTGKELTVQISPNTRISAGNHTLRAEYSENDNFKASLKTCTFKVTPLELSVNTSSLLILNKADDGTVKATAEGTIALTGVLKGDEVKLSKYTLKAEFADTTPGRNKPVTVLITGLSCNNADYKVADKLSLILYADITASETTSAEPDVTSNEPETTSQEPASTSKEPEVTSQEPVSTSKEPEVTSPEPVTTSAVPEITSDNSETIPVDSEALTAQAELTTDTDNSADITEDKNESTNSPFNPSSNNNSENKSSTVIYILIGSITAGVLLIVILTVVLTLNRKRRNY